MTRDRRDRPGPMLRVSVEEVSASQTRHREDRVIAEEPLEIRLGWPGSAPERTWVTMRTPGHDFELAAGWLLHEGIAGAGALGSVAYCTEQDLTPQEEFNVVTVTLREAPAASPAQRQPALSTGSSACGVCGKDSIEAALTTTRAAAWSGTPLPPEVVRTLPSRLLGRQELFDATGGVHAAGLADSEGHIVLAREDVGRHNAVDKVVGARLLAGERPAAAALVISGRAGFELVQKAVAAGHGCLVAVGAPSSLAVALARESKLALWGFTSEARAVRYA